MKRPSRPVRPGRLARGLKALRRLVSGNPRRDDLDLAPTVPRIVSELRARMVSTKAMNRQTGAARPTTTGD